MVAPATAHAAAPAHASSRMCANTYGGDVVRATNNLSCSNARRIVRAWAVGYRRDGRVDRSAIAAVGVTTATKA